MTFLRNVWYAAAWLDQIEPGRMLARRILAEPLIFFRDADGQIAALADRCPHRFAPLHLGRLADGQVTCGYHGLRFNGEGACTLNPHGDGKIAPGAKVKSYPVVERHRAAWIWMGAPELADPGLIPDFSAVINDRMTAVPGYLNPQSNYEIMTDNLLDLGHTAYLHGDSLGSDAIVNSERKVKREGDTLVYDLWAPDGEAPPLFKVMMPWYAEGHVDHWLTSRWMAPGNIQQQIGFAPVGTDRQDGHVMEGMHWLTPETETSCHYFFAMSRSYRLDDNALDAYVADAVEKAFATEDLPMAAAVQDAIGNQDFWEMSPVVLSVDTGGVMARRVLKSRLDREATEMQSSAA